MIPSESFSRISLNCSNDTNATRQDISCSFRIDVGIDKNEMKRLVIALAELDLTIDEWLCFKMKELILAEKLSKENRGEE